MADEVILLPIYPARELPIEGVTSQMILDKMNKAARSVKEKEEVMNWIETEYAGSIDKEFGNILITAGAGDIDVLVARIKESLNGFR